MSDLEKDMQNDPFLKAFVPLSDTVIKMESVKKEDQLRNCNPGLFYDQLCKLIDANELPVEARFAVLCALVWYIAPELGYDAKKTIENFSRCINKWDSKQTSRF